MTMREYYEELKQAWEKVNKNSLQEVKAYNEWKRELRKLVDEGEK